MRKAFIEQVPQAVSVISGRDAEWDTCRSVLEGHSHAVSAVVFSPDGQLVASASQDSTVRVWETATGQCRTLLEDQHSRIFRIAFSPDGRTLHTNRGDIPLPLDLITVASAFPAQELPYAVVDSEWVLRQTWRFLWLPPQYRNCVTAVYRHTVCLGCYSGRVAILSFSQNVVILLRVHRRYIYTATLS